MFDNITTWIVNNPTLTFIIIIILVITIIYLYLKYNNIAIPFLNDKDKQEDAKTTDKFNIINNEKVNNEKSVKKEVDPIISKLVNDINNNS